MKSIIEYFDSLKKESYIAIISHTYPDPDSIGSAFGIKWFLKKIYNIESDIFYDGQISHTSFFKEAQGFILGRN